MFQGILLSIKNIGRLMRTAGHTVHAQERGWDTGRTYTYAYVLLINKPSLSSNHCLLAHCIPINKLAKERGCPQSKANWNLESPDRPGIKQLASGT